MSVALSGCLLAQSALEQAADLTRRGEYSKARAMLTGVAEPAGRDQRIAFHRLRAAIASGLHEPQIAVSEMKAALAFDPTDSKLLLATAVAELQARQVAEALSHAEASSENATREALIGDIQEKRQDFVHAVQAYEAAVALAPDQEQYRIALGLELIEHQDFDKAIKGLQSAAAMFPKSPKIRTLLGIAEYAQGYSDDAVRSLEEAIQINPKLDTPYGALTKIVLQSSAAPPQKTIDCLCAWNRVVCSALELRVARETGNAALQTEATAELKSRPADSAIGRCELGRAYEWNGQLEAARIEMEACVRLDPSPQNHYRLGQLYRKLGLTALAEREMEQRQQILVKMSEQTALGLNALQELNSR